MMCASVFLHGVHTLTHILLQLKGLYNSINGDLSSWFTAAAEEEGTIKFQAQVFTPSVRHRLSPFPSRWLCKMCGNRVLKKKNLREKRFVVHH